jgi:hypothetical protein
LDDPTKERNLLLAFSFSLEDGESDFSLTPFSFLLLPLPGWVVSPCFLSCSLTNLS